MSDMYNLPPKTHLGDGAYISPGRFLGEIILTTEDGITAQNTIYLGPGEIGSLLAWIEKHAEAMAEPPSELSADGNPVT